MMLEDKDLESLEERRKHVITVVGCGRMGLPTACLFSEAGFNVICFDSDPYVVDGINKGSVSFDEPGLTQLLKKNLKEGRIKATVDAKESVSQSDIIILTVNTSIDRKKRADYSNLEESCRTIGLNLKPGSLIILESTVGPSVTETLVKQTLEKSSGLKAGIDRLRISLQPHQSQHRKNP